MSEVNTFLRILKKEGYPNPDIQTIAKYADYDIDNFLIDIYNDVGQDKTEEFIKHALKSIETEDKGIFLLLNSGDGFEEFIYVKPIKPHYDLDVPCCVIFGIEWGESQILSGSESGEDVYKTIEQIEDEVDMGDWDYDELKDLIKSKLSDKMLDNLGFTFDLA